MLGQTGGILDGEPRIPDAVGVDHRVGTIEAWSETSARCDEHVIDVIDLMGLIGAAREQLVLHRRDQVVTPPRPACRFPGRTVVCADEQMTASHEVTMFVPVRRVNPSG